MNEARDGIKIVSRAPMFHLPWIPVAELTLRRTRTHVPSSFQSVPLYAVASPILSLLERVPWCTRFHHHYFHTYPMWDIYRQLEWYVIFLQPPTVLFIKRFLLEAVSHHLYWKSFL